MVTAGAVDKTIRGSSGLAPMTQVPSLRSNVTPILNAPKRLLMFRSTEMVMIGVFSSYPATAETRGATREPGPGMAFANAPNAPTSEPEACQVWTPTACAPNVPTNEPVPDILISPAATPPKVPFIEPTPTPVKGIPVACAPNVPTNEPVPFSTTSPVACAPNVPTNEPVGLSTTSPALAPPKVPAIEPVPDTTTLPLPVAPKVPTREPVLPV